MVLVVTQEVINPLNASPVKLLWLLFITQEVINPLNASPMKHLWLLL